MFDKVLEYVRGISGVPLISAGVLLVIWYFTPKLNDKRPPFPWLRLPIIGNIISLSRSKEAAYVLMYKTSKQPKYDKLFMIKLGGHELCIINHIQILREALNKKPQHFADKVQLYSFNYATAGGKDIFMGRYGPVWEVQRKVAHKALRKFASGNRLEEIIQNATNQALKLVEKKAELGEPFIIKPILELLVFNSLTGLMFGKEYDFDDPEFSRFRDVTKDGIEAVGRGLPADLFPALSILPFQVNKLDKFLSIYQNLLEGGFKEHKESFDPDNLRDITDYLLHAQRELEAEDETTRGMLTEQHLIYTLFDVFGAGVDTLNAVIQFGIAEAISYPETQDKMAREISQVLGQRMPGLSDKSSLPYTEAFMCEILRHDTMTVFSSPLATTCDTTLGNYELPKGTGVVINFWALHNDPDYWENPSDFRPERFLDDTGELGPRPDSYMPFSRGKRNCLGENMSKAMLMIMQPMIFQRFKFTKPENFDFESIDGGFVVLPSKYHVCVENRN